MSRRPNVILISSDQQRGDCIGYERRAVDTPHIDQIAKEGARFTRCITPHPMCQAARASILTGLLPYTNGVRDNGRDLAPSFGETGLGGVFSSAGYHTHFVGKAHFATHETFKATGQPECYKSADKYSGDWCGPYFGFNNTRLMLRPHHHTVWANPPQTLHYENWLDQDGEGRKRWEKAKKGLSPRTAHFQAWRSALEEEWHSSAWCADEAIKIIERAGADPFFLWISFPDPHPPFEAPRPWCDQYHPETVDLPPHYELDLDRRPWWHRAFLDNKDRTRHAPQNWQGGVNWGERGDLSEKALRDITAIYYGMISELDHHMGRALASLDGAGLKDDTFVVFISDHGEWLGDHGLLLKGPMLYDGLLRVPCVIRGPGVPAGRIVRDPVSTIDLRATLADLCDLEISTDHGLSWLDLLSNKGSRDFAFNEWEVDARRSGIDLDLKTVRTCRHRISLDERTGAGELYDLQEDPFEMENIFEDPSKARVRRELIDMIRSRPADEIQASERVGWH